MNYTMNSRMEDDLEALFESAQLNTLERKNVLNKIDDHYEEMYGMSPSNRHEFYNQIISEWIKEVHQASANAGWWKSTDDLIKIVPDEFKSLLNSLVKSSKQALIHSEVSEALEGVRKDCQDKHLPRRKTEEVEMADAVIRIFDYCGKYNIDLPGAMIEKLEYNKTRADHKPEARAAEGGKKI